MERTTIKQQSDEVQIQVVTRSFRAIGTKHACLPEEKRNEIPKALEAFRSRMAEIPHRTGNGLMVHGIGAETSNDSRKEKWCVTAEVSTIDHIPDGLSVIDLQETQYACYEHRGGIYRIGDAYSKLHVWILKNGDYTDGCMVELSDEHFRVADEGSVVHVYAPFRWKDTAG